MVDIRAHTGMLLWLMMQGTHVTSVHQLSELENLIQSLNESLQYSARSSTVEAKKYDNVQACHQS